MAVKIEIYHHIIIGVRKLIWHSFSPENMKIGHINKKVRSMCSVKPCKHNMSTASQRTTGSVSAAINYWRKICLETAMPSTWIHFNGGSGHKCLGTSHYFWVTHLWYRNREQTLSKTAVRAGIWGSSACCGLALYSFTFCVCWCTDEKSGGSSDLAKTKVSLSQLLALVVLTWKGLMES